MPIANLSCIRRGCAPFFLLVGILFFLEASAVAIKPQPPLHLLLWTTNRPDDTIEVTLQATANSSVSSVELSFLLPESLSLVSGEKKWAGALKAGENKSLTVLLQGLAGSSPTVIGEATVHFPEGGSFVQRSQIVLNPKKKEPSFPPSPAKRKQEGETILEFQGK